MEYSRHMLYILYNESNNYTYNGYTVDFNRRLRQHNCEIKGGARFTSRLVKSKKIIWKPLALIRILNEDFDQRRALSIEWIIKYPTNQRPRPKNFNTPKGRIEGLILALMNSKFEGLSFHVQVFSQDIFDLINENYPNIFVELKDQEIIKE